MIRRLALVLAALPLLAPTRAWAQTPAPVVVRVTVLDSLGAPIAGAEVRTLRGLHTTLASGLTDSAGRRTMLVPRDGDRDLEVSVRRLGYVQGAQFFRANADTIDMTVKLRPAPQLLQAVSVTAEENLKRKRNFIDADAIAASDRHIGNALDVVTKLRPDMIRPPGQGIFTSCGLSYVWVNGRRIVYAPIHPTLETITRQQRYASRLIKHNRSRAQSAINLNVQSVLYSIKPEHILEMTYHDCSDTTVQKARTEGALFVVLKDGIAYEPGRGSYPLTERDKAK